MPNLRTFGVEFEANLKGYCRDISCRMDEWGFQADPTACAEFCSPVWTRLEDAWEDTKQQFQTWANINPSATLFWKGDREHSRIGAHVHVGTWNWRRREDILNAVYLVGERYSLLPFAYFVSANSYREGHYSTRLRRPYSPSLENITEEHLGCGRPEISFNSHGTLEHRWPDANLPPISLTVAWLIQTMYSFPLRSQVAPYWEGFRMRDRILRFGEVRELQTAREQWKALKEVPLPDIPEFKHILILAFRFMLNPSYLISTYSQEVCMKASTGMEFLSLIPYRGERKWIVDEIRRLERNTETMGDLLKPPIVTKVLAYQYFVADEEPQGIPIKPWVKDYVKERAKAFLPVDLVPNDWRLEVMESKGPGWRRLRDIPEWVVHEIARAAQCPDETLFTSPIRYLTYYDGERYLATIGVMHAERAVVEQYELVRGGLEVALRNLPPEYSIRREQECAG